MRSGLSCSAKFAPATSSSLSTSSSTDNYTLSPPPKHTALALRRAGTVADRITEKLRAASVSKPPSSLSPSKPVVSVDGKALPPPPSPLRSNTPEQGELRSPSSPNREDRFTPPTDPNGRPSMHLTNGKGPHTPGSPNVDLHPPPILLSGLSLPAQALKDLLHRFDAYLLTNPAPYSDASTHSSTRSNAALASRCRSTILGTYEKTFAGEEVVEWLRQEVEGFGSDWERCVEAAGELLKMGHFSRIGVGRGFEPSFDVYYTLKVNPAESASSITSNLGSIGSPLSPATSANIQSIFKQYLPASLGQSDEPAHVRARREANKADEAYKEGVKSAEEKRLEMEERIERGLRLWERWERERLGVVRTVLKQYEDALARLPARLADLQPGTALSVEAFNPEADIKALIEGNRTGPFRPHPHIYESVESDLPEANFGIDLRKWAGDQGWRSAINAPARPKGAIPDVLGALFKALEEMYAEASDEERRKSWIYEVPLHESHMLRNAINNPKMLLDDMVAVVKKFNLPVAAGTVKLYLLELNPPVLGWEGWEDAKAVYPSVGADQERDVKSALTSVLGRLPGAQLYVLDAVVKHLRELIDTTKTEESNEMYTTKLALSVGRCILRPQYETEMTIQDRTPSLFLADLINLHDAVFPPLVEKKKAEVERVMPVRKRTALVDQRISRSRLSGDVNAEQMLAAQHAAQHPGARLPEPAEKAQPEFSEKSLPSEPTKDPPRPVIDALRPVTPAAPFTTAPSTPAAAPPLLGPPAMGPPVMHDPVDSDEEEDGGKPVNVFPPTPEPLVPSDGKMPDPAFDEITSPTADILESMQPSLSADGDMSITTGSAALRRATSGDGPAASRLRGPRVARGPRPAPGRVPSHAATGSLGGMVGGGDGDGEESGRESPALDAGRKGGARPGSRGGVSAAIAQFEGRDR